MHMCVCVGVGVCSASAARVMDGSRSGHQGDMRVEAAPSQYMSLQLTPGWEYISRPP